jgi:hypothetical protein
MFRLHKMVTNRTHETCGRGDKADRQMQQGAGRRIAGACKARVRFGHRLLLVCTALCISTPTKLLASSDGPPPAATSFAYRVNHAVTPLPDSVIEKVADAENTAEAAFEEDMAKDAEVAPPRTLSRPELCSTLASVAHVNDLPVPFFANLIWHESSFNTGVVSRAGAQGIAQFMPRTAAMFDLINPFEPIHAINVAGKFLRELHDQFGNLGLAAAAYNAGPRRVSDWQAGRGGLPAETRRYVTRITGRPAEYWLQGKSMTGSEALLMPAKAPCIEVAIEVERQVQLVRVARLVNELAGAAAQAKRGAEDEGGETSAVASAGKRRGMQLASADSKAAKSTEAKAARRANGAAKSPDAKSPDAKTVATKTLDASASRRQAKAGANADKSQAQADPRSKSSAKSPARAKATKPEEQSAGKAQAKADSAAAAETKNSAKSKSGETAKESVKPSAKEAAKETVKETAKEAVNSATPRRKAVRRQRIVNFDRHIANH